MYSASPAWMDLIVKHISFLRTEMIKLICFRRIIYHIVLLSWNQFVVLLLLLLLRWGTQPVRTTCAAAVRLIIENTIDPDDIWGKKRKWNGWGQRRYAIGDYSCTLYIPILGSPPTCLLVLGLYITIYTVIRLSQRASWWCGWGLLLPSGNRLGTPPTFALHTIRLPHQSISEL